MKQWRNWVVNAPTRITAIIPNNLSLLRALRRTPLTPFRRVICQRRRRHRRHISRALWKIKRRLASRDLSAVKNRSGCCALDSSSLLMDSSSSYAKRDSTRSPREIATARAMLSLTLKPPNFTHYLVRRYAFRRKWISCESAEARPR